MGKRIVMTSTLAGVLVCVLAAPAAADVTVDPPSAPQGSTVKLWFLVPNEEATAKVTEIEVAFPTPPEAPIPSVSVEAKPGWTVHVTQQKLTKPIVTDDGSISEIVSLIDWKVVIPSAAITTGQFGEFTIDADGLPDNENEVVFRAIQRLLERRRRALDRPGHAERPGGRAPDADPRAHQGGECGRSDHGAVSGSSSRTTIVATSTQDNSARALAIIGIVLGAIALILADRRGPR